MRKVLNVLALVFSLVFIGCFSNFNLKDRMDHLSNENNISYVNPVIKNLVKKTKKEDENLLIVLGFQCNDYSENCFYRGILYNKDSKEKYYFKETKSSKIRFAGKDENYEILQYILDLSINNNLSYLREFENVEINHLWSYYYIYDMNNQLDELHIFKNVFMDSNGLFNPASSHEQQEKLNLK